MKTLDEYLKKPYRMNIKEDKDEGGYVVFFPELPGCITCGETIESAVKNAEDAKRMAYSCFRRRNKNLIMQIKVSWETKAFLLQKGGKIMTIGKKIVSVFYLFDAVFGMRGGVCRHFHGNGIKQGKSVCKGRKQRAASDLEGRD